jgi:hypothetical protein
VDAISEQRSSGLAGVAYHSGVLGCPDHDRGVRPVFLSLLPSANQLRADQAAQEEQDGTVQEHFQALGIAQMEARRSNVPAESEGSAVDQDKDASDILRPSLTPTGLIVVRDHQRPPTEK